ncbi:DNA-directed RNA polymerase subunit delta [Catellicoccus marimammalium]|uniref:Probable DNA-directed RNA polymerase subunit delta n=1 Tax=Catellicoccus marimammalium M35/04/3 TaxID=1234409 RepID=K8Z8B3_9ENTE|nr:DNA-directed RNA polymerase subunit delta [Catellicoccus marimammalium]EKU27070.1 DNA-directed RNA polymerase delta subunit [Catellicoccus marimammalium M35/04/3]
MELTVFGNTPKEELSMIEVAKAILQETKSEIELNQLFNEVQEFLELSNQEMRENLSQFYTDLNIDGSFISLGENRWGLREWYPIDSIDEEVSHTSEDEEEMPRKKVSHKVNAFMDNDENAIDYSNDDPEDNDLVLHNNEDDLYDDEHHNEEISDYDNELSEMDEDSIPEGIEEELTVVDHEDMDGSLR